MNVSVNGTLSVHTCVQKDSHIPPSSNWCCRASVKTPLVAPVSRWRGADVFHINPLYHSFFYAIIHSSSCFISVTWSFWIFLFHFKTELCHSPVWRIWCHAQKSINPSPRHHKLQSSSANGGRRRPCLRERFGFYGPSRLTALRQWDHINSTLSAAAVCLNNTVWTVLEMTLWMWVTRYKTKVSEPYFPQQMRLWGAAGVRGNCCPHDIYPQRELKYDHPWCVCGGGGGVLQRKLDDVRECFTGLFRVKLEKRTLMMSSKILIIELQKTPLWCICAV